MLRWLLVVAAALATLVVDVQMSLAAEGGSSWPALGAPFSRAPGAYLSPWKILTTWVLFLAWVRTTDWVSQDGQLMNLRYGRWNPIVYFSFLLALILFWILPWFIPGFILMLIAYAVPLTAYVIYRNKAVPASDKVLTRQHIRRYLARKIASVGIKVEGADIDPRDLGPEVKLQPMGGATDRDNNVNLLTARQSPGWMPSRELLDDALKQRATHMMLDYSAESVGVRYQIDGVWLERAPMDRVSGDAILAVYKGMAALKISDRRSRQSGTFGVDVAKEKMTCAVTTQGTQSGERALLQLSAKKIEFKTLDELGMRAKMQEQLDALMARPGVLVFSALPGGGLTTTMDVAIMRTDRFVRAFVALCEENSPDRDIENVPVSTYSATGAEPIASALATLVRAYPDVLIVRDVPDLETLTVLCDQVGLDRTVLISVRAKEAVEALLRVLLLKMPPGDFAPVASGVLNVRLIRKLCEKCKEAYPPPAETLKQLGLPAGRVEALYRPPTEPIDPKHPDVVCDQCNGVGYFGRTAIFELLVLDDNLRQVLATTPKLEALRQAARKAKHRTLQEEGVLLVARGVTSLQELLRVLKQ